jgi:hypothetical protein
VLVLKIALGIVLGFVLIAILQFVFALALLRGLVGALPTAHVVTSRPAAASAARLATSRPTPSRASPSPAPGYGRLMVLVLDGSTGQPVSGVCVTLRTTNCNAATDRTDASGRRSLDVLAGSPTIYLSHPDYGAEQRQLILNAGQSTSWQISMRRSR